MKAAAKILFLFLSLSQITVFPQKSVRGSRPYGFFADFLWVVNHLQYCKENNLTPVIYWGSVSSYYAPEGYNGVKDNVWEYYFEPVSSEQYVPGDPLRTEIYYSSPTNFTSLSEYYQYVETKYKLPAEEQPAFKPIENHHQRYCSNEFDRSRVYGYPLGKEHLYSKTFRTYVKEQLIDPYIKPKESITEKIENFYNTYMANKKTIGIHLRGIHIGAETLPVPLEYIFQEANQYADRGYQFFIATDQYPLIEAAKKNLRGDVIYYECERFEKTTSPFGTFKLHPKLGEDILIEMCLLSMTEHFIHTLSNVSTAVLYFNPDLTHTIIY